MASRGLSRVAAGGLIFLSRYHGELRESLVLPQQTRRGLTTLFQLCRDAKIDVRNGEDPWVPASTQDEALFIPATMCEDSRGSPCNAKGDLTSLRRHKWIPQVETQLEVTLSFLPQFHANHEILPCRLEEALLCCSVSKESPRSLLDLERVFDTL